ncbi:D-2-hydroxyacid dehydrogenase [Georgenia subflava]|uniref:D-2-hydroxyacid dehydrogenase n=1 Tax=Georgenia subflava TaxID=1622177 RepID=UPI0012656519|nr:D-2-hydroxyacid dehydrogenase [Georgenia subflava]
MTFAQQGSRRRIAVLCANSADRPPHLAALEERADVAYTDADGLEMALADADALFLWDFFSTAVRDAWPSAGRLRWIHVAAAGVDSLLFDELRASDVVVTNAKGVFDRPIAEFVLMSVLAHAKDARGSLDRQRERRWEHRETTLVAGSTALVVGTGAIGREIARLLRAVGVEVQGAGRSARDGDPDFGSVIASTDLVAHVGRADHVVVVTPLTPATTGLIDAEVLAAMKPTAHLVNVGRGAVVVEDDLVAALTAGRLAAASLDVFATEPLPSDNPLWTTPGVSITAHMSGDTFGWRETLARQFVDNALRWLDGEELANVVDKELGFVPSTQPAGEPGR